MHVFGSEENFKYFIALVLKLLMKNISNLFVRLFVISLLTFRYFSVIVSIFGAGADPFFTAPAPAPAPSKPFRRLRLRLRLRPKCIGSGGSGSGSGSGSASLVTAYAIVTGSCRDTQPTGWGISARAHVQRYPHTALLYLGNGLAGCVQIWYVGWGSLTKCLPQVIDGVHLHVRTCVPLFHKCSACCFSVTVGPIASKFGMHLGTH